MPTNEPQATRKTLDGWGRGARDTVAISETDPLLGITLGRFRLVSVLGRGGMGVVYKAEDVGTRQAAAVKLLPASLTDNPQSVARLQREAELAANLSHPNIIKVLDFGIAKGHAYLAMELVHGVDGEALLTKGPLVWREATRIITDITRGLVAAHAAGLVHRDIKPGNILCAADGQVKLGDFGLAFQTGQSSISGRNSALGTPDFASPEQIQSEYVDHRTDIYSLGATYFTFLTNRGPFQDAGDTRKILTARLRLPPPDPRAFVPNVPAGVAAIIAKAMARKPDDRYDSAESLQADLMRVQSGMPIDGEKPYCPPSWIPRWVVVVLIFGIVVLAFELVWLVSTIPPAASPNVTNSSTSITPATLTPAVSEDLAIQASQRLNQPWQVRLTVGSVGRNADGWIFLNSTLSWKDPKCFAIVIHPDDVVKFSQVGINSFEEHFRNAEIVADGTVIEHRNTIAKIALQLRSPEQFHKTTAIGPDEAAKWIGRRVLVEFVARVGKMRNGDNDHWFLNTNPKTAFSITFTKPALAILRTQGIGKVEDLRKPYEGKRVRVVGVVKPAVGNSQDWRTIFVDNPKDVVLQD